ncbi:uncharacterized protein LOC134781595 [Penaeus indicus]|uniref:uncharacterized protein LOC134781595 n=1 Tax=Penaeus indicus TaxID=29960 RepID=UPI00300C122E
MGERVSAAGKSRLPFSRTASYPKFTNYATTEYGEKYRKIENVATDSPSAAIKGAQAPLQPSIAAENPRAQSLGVSETASSARALYGQGVLDAGLSSAGSCSDVSECDGREVSRLSQDIAEASFWAWSSSSSGYQSGVGTSEVSTGDPPASDDSLTADEIGDDDNDDDSDWGEDEWPLDRALPLPEWGCERPELNFENLENYERFLGQVSLHLRHVLSAHSYDTVSNFILFSKEYVLAREEYPDLEEFYRDYDPPILPGRYTCVGLACDLTTRLSALEIHYPGLKDSVYQVSCEEEVDNAEWYCSTEVPPVNTCEKEHVLVCVRIRVSGRAGVLLLDPGYHVGVPITVMEDGQAPQTGAITANTARPEVVRTYRYSYWPDNPAFVSWEVTEEREGKAPHHHISLIHIARPFLSGVDVAERRNLVYPFKTLVGRDQNGRLTCGLYFPLRECSRTTVGALEEKVKAAVSGVARGTGRSAQDIRSSLVAVANLLHDSGLLKQLEDLNEAINDISKDN